MLLTKLIYDTINITNIHHWNIACKQFYFVNILIILCFCSCGIFHSWK